MNTRIERLDETNIDEAIIVEAGSIIKAGGLVAFPTETVYGLGGDALNKESSAKIYKAKGRPSDNPLIVHIAEVDALYNIARNIPDEAFKLAGAFWPGPLTMILEKDEKVPYETTGGLDTVAVRMPVHPVALDFIKAGGGYIAAPSANRSGRPSPTEAKYVVEDLNGLVEMIIDGGASDIGLESTIIDLTSSVPMVLRPGFVTVEELQRVLGRVEIDRTIIREDEGIAPKAPGMKYRHYAPKGDVTIVYGEESKVIDYINDQVAMASTPNVKTGVIAVEETFKNYSADVVKNIGSRKDELAIARNLFKILREMDDEEVEVIFTESFGKDGISLATMNRLLKAAGHKEVKL